MALITSTDFLIEVAKGKIPGHKLIHKFGRNMAVANGTWEHVSLLSGASAFLSAATTVRVKAGDVADTAAGAGAREITVVGIDNNLNEVTEAIATAGTSASSATTALFWRVYRAYVSACGTYGASNTAAVTIENSGGGTDLIQIAAEEGQSQYGGYTVPTGKKAYLVSLLLTADAAKAADFKLMTRANFNNTSAPMSPVRLRNYWDGVLGTLRYHPDGPVKYDALTDIWIESEGGGVNTEVSVDFELLIVDD